MIEVGTSYLFHTPLGIWLGRVREADHSSVLLDTCCWVADQGMMGACVRTGSITALEYVGDGVVLPRGFIAVPWIHALPPRTGEPRVRGPSRASIRGGSAVGVGFEIALAGVPWLSRAPSGGSGDSRRIRIRRPATSCAICASSRASSCRPIRARRGGGA